MKIRQAKNGLILEVTEVNENQTEKIVYQERYDEEVECFADFLRLMNENFGPTTSRHSEKRIYIQVKPGDNFPGQKET